MQRLKVSGAVRPIYGSLGVKRLTKHDFCSQILINVSIINFHEKFVQWGSNCLMHTDRRKTDRRIGLDMPKLIVDFRIFTYATKIIVF